MSTDPFSRRAHRWVTRQLGPYSVLARKGATQRDRVWELADEHGDRWFLKQVRDERDWRRERRAYRDWVPALGDRAPRLRAAQPVTRSLLMSAVPGAPVPPRDPAMPQVQQQLGELLRRFHDAAPVRPLPAGSPETVLQRFRAVATKHTDLIDPDVARRAQERVVDLRHLRASSMVPCYGDLVPRNMIRDGRNGLVRLVDFAGARWNPPAYDFARLTYSTWWNRPSLARSFFAGYGREPSDQEVAYVRARVTVQAMMMVHWGRRHGDAGAVRRGLRRLGTDADHTAFLG